MGPPGLRGLVGLTCTYNFFEVDPPHHNATTSHVESSQTFPINEPQYRNKNATTPKATNLYYQPRVRTNLRGIENICET